MPRNRIDDSPGIQHRRTGHYRWCVSCMKMVPPLTLVLYAYEMRAPRSSTVVVAGSEVSYSCVRFKIGSEFQTRW